MTCLRALTNFPRELASSAAPFCHLEPCRAAPISETTLITDPVRTRASLHIAIPSPYTRWASRKWMCRRTPAARWWYRPRRSICWGRRSLSRTMGAKEPNAVIGFPMEQSEDELVAGLLDAQGKAEALFAE